MPISSVPDEDQSWGDEIRAVIAAINGLEGTTTANLPETIRDTIAAALVAGANVTITPSDGADTITIAASGGGGGSLDTEGVQDVIGSTVVGSGLITATYNDAAGTHTISTTATAWDAEQTRDTIASALVGGTNVTITPNDAGDTITIAAGGGGIAPTIVDAKGDLIAATAADTVARLAAGTNGSVLTAASGQSAGLSWSPGTQVHAVGNSGTALTLDAASTSGFIKTVILTGNCTFTFTGATSGLVATLELILTQDATGGRTATWPTSVKWSGGAPLLSTAAAAVDRVLFTSYNGGTTWFGDLVGKGYA